MRNYLLAITTGAALMLSTFAGNACTNYLITKGASKNGSVMISYAADSHTLYGELYYKAPATYPAGTMMKVYEWDTSKYLGEIPQARETYNVLGNVNEYQVAIGETTYTGRTELQDTTGLVDYGSLIYITLQRSKSAREAIKVMTDLVANHGYYSTGESFSIADQNEAWILEMIGKGPGVKGANWVARRIPDGYVSGHANQARITQFPKANGKTSITNKQMNRLFNPAVECVYSYDVIKFAKSKGYVDKKMKHEEFSFSDTYAPVDFGGARFCDMRVWAMFDQVSTDMDKYWEYAKGNITHDEKTGYANNRMPLWIKPNRKIDVQDMMHFMRNHLEGTELDMTQDPGAGAFGVPYRWRPMTWEYEGKTYCNERATGTQQTGFSFIAELRSDLPREIGVINWFSVGNASTSVYMPIYANMTKAPETLKQGNGDMLTYSPTSAFWTFNKVTNFAYLRWSYMYKDITKVQSELENKFVAEIATVDAKAKELLATDRDAAIKYLTEYSCKTADATKERYDRLFEFLLVKYIDGNIKKETNGVFERTADGVAVFPDQPGYDENWKRNVVEKVGKLKEVVGGGH
ncbi:MAG: C69 family dipeptidase [Paludibacteraceae bacterium]|nr:C69 family dipeptidase [Paludibacteraceae bacterium]